MSAGAIETTYRGCRFRSRLEARWAVFLDELRITWKYEDQGYEVDGFRCLPDFWLPDLSMYAEVKGDPNGLRSDFDRMSVILGPRSPLPGFADGTTSLMVLGEVPDVSYGVTVLHPCLTRSSLILQRTWGFFAPMKAGNHTFVFDANQSRLSMLFGRFAFNDPGESSDSAGWDTRAWVLDTPGGFDTCLNAYRAARGARFEHGANGR